MEPLAQPELDDYLHPSVLDVALNDGLCEADGATIEIQWTTQYDYNFHTQYDCGLSSRESQPLSRTAGTDHQIISTDDIEIS